MAAAYRLSERVAFAERKTVSLVLVVVSNPASGSWISGQSVFLRLGILAPGEQRDVAAMLLCQFASAVSSRPACQMDAFHAFETWRQRADYLTVTTGVRSGALRGAFFAPNM